MDSTMTASNIRHRLYDYIRVAEDKKVKAIYTMLEDEIEEAKAQILSSRIAKKK